MITVNNLKKKFGKLEALKGVDVTFNPGEITAVLGPNGAGKTTLIKSILGLVRPDEGTIYFDEKPLKGDYTYRERIGYMPQQARYPENLTVKEILGMIRDLRNYPEKQDEELVKMFNLESEMNKQFKTLSGGNKQKMSAVLAFLFCPDVLFLDEPTAGLDPIASSKLKDKIITEKNNGKTIILTSHIMSEIQELADKVVYLLEGRLHFVTTVPNLLDDTGQPNLERALASKLEGEAA